jgi:glycerophosphoryl diester phosphodiesterase
MTATAIHAIELLGHRGARGLAPENTLPGFARALAIGVSGFELDCAITRDGVVVIHHDAVLNPDFARGPDGKWLDRTGPAIWTLTFAELQDYDVGRIQPGSDYARRFPTQNPVDGTRIPRLADLFALVRKAGNEAARCYLELKLSPLMPKRTAGPDEFARKVIAVVREAGMTQRVAILSFDWRALAAARKVAPEIPTVHLTAQQGFMDNILAGKRESPWTAGLRVNDFGGSIPRMVHAASGAAWAPFHEELTRERVKEAHALDLKVMVWTANEPAAMRRMIEWRVDGIISDYPDVLRKVAGEMGVALPPATPVVP